MERKWANDLSKLNKVELVKLEKDGLDIIHDIDRFAREGFSSVTEKDLDLLKWLGLYISRPKEDGYFLLRVKVPGGILSSAQARELAGISRDYGRNLLDISTRHAVQLHWIRVEHLPDILARLEEVGLSCIESAGDCPRTIVGSAVEGVDASEVIDAGPLLQEMTDYFHNNKDFSNLPRKFKISISGSVDNPVHAEINDLAFVPAEKATEGKLQRGFNVLVGGGLSSAPQMAREIDVFVLQHEVLAVAKAVATIFRDHGYRERRNHARLKFLLNDWGVAKFRDEVEKITGPLKHAGRDLTSGWNAGCFHGVRRQKQSGLNYVGLCIPVGRLCADEMAEVARLAEEYGDGAVATTNAQNIVLLNVPDEKVGGLLKEEVLKRLCPQPNPLTAHAVSCTGTQFCPLGLVETKQRVGRIVEYLDRRVQLDMPFVLHVSGCMNSCGQHQIADIGLQGTVTRIDEQNVEAFEVWVGGRLGPQASFANKLRGRIAADNAAIVVEALLRDYLALHQEGELYHDYVGRMGLEHLQEQLNRFAV